MKNFKKFLFVIGLISLYYLVAPNRLYAYLDPGSGSYIMQIIIGIAIGGAFGVKIFWRRIYGFFKKRSMNGQNKHDTMKKNK